MPGTITAVMGQLITVSQRESVRPGVVSFDLNRSLTGMGHERYFSPDDVVDDRPCDVLATRLFEHAGVKVVHVYSNVVTVEMEPGSSTEGMADTIRDLFTYYREGVEVADPMAGLEAATDSASG